MNISLCTISFRHHLLSLSDIAAFARRTGFDGIELWAPHAHGRSGQLDKDADWLGNYGLNVPMISDYLPLDSDAATLKERAESLCLLARHWKARKVRTFAGNKASAETSSDERQFMVARLREVAVVAESHGIHLLVETHPNTLTDNGVSTIRLLEELGHPALGINFDVLHVWEGGNDPVSFHEQIGGYVHHYHLKNITERKHLSVFTPVNVYTAAQDRTGMCPLFSGAVDYGRVIAGIPKLSSGDASLEWFGDDPLRVLEDDLVALRRSTEFSGPRPAHDFSSRQRFIA